MQSYYFISFVFTCMAMITWLCGSNDAIVARSSMLRLADDQLNNLLSAVVQEVLQFTQTLKYARERPLAYLQLQQRIAMQRFQALSLLSTLELSSRAKSPIPILSNSAYELLSQAASSPVAGKGLHIDPDARMTAPEMITFRGYTVETHPLVTEDCYILNLHRIVHPSLPADKHRRPVLLQHGLMGTSADFLMNSIGGNWNSQPPDDRSLAFNLARLGYDVWLANSRGNTYSPNHTQFDPQKDKKYWQFSFDEMSKFDLPATIAYIRNYTGHDNLGYVGHSQGTLIMFQLLSTQPAYSKIIKPFVALAPVFRLNHVRTPLRYLASANQLHRYFLKNYDSFLNLKNSRFSSLFIELFCRDRIDYFCKNLLFMFGGYDPLQLNSTRLPVYLNNFPAGTSTYNILHYGQIVRDKRVTWFNYENMIDNQKCYGSDLPPEILLNTIDSQYITLISSHNDWLSDQEDVDFIRNNLKVKFKDFVIPFKEWNHFDFIIGMEADKYVNRLVLQVLQEHDEEESAAPSPISGFPLPMFSASTCDMNAKCYVN